MSAPCVASIVIPLSSQNDLWLEQCVRSALGQTAATQVIVVTSPNTPPSNLAVLERLRAAWPELLVLRQTARGFANAINLGFRAAGASRIGLLLSDDWLLPGAVENCLCHDADIVSTGLAAFAADGESLLEAASVDLKQSVFEGLPTLERKANYLSHFFLFQKARVDEAGGLDESLGDAPGVDDYDFIWTLLERGARVTIVEERLYCYRDHDQDRLTLRPPAEQAATLTKILAKHGLAGRERERVLRMHERWFGKPIHKALAEIAAAGRPGER